MKSKKALLQKGAFFLPFLGGGACVYSAAAGPPAPAFTVAVSAFYGGVCFFTAAVAFRGDLHLLFGRHLLFPMAAMPAFFGVGACVFSALVCAGRFSVPGSTESIFDFLLFMRYSRKR